MFTQRSITTKLDEQILDSLSELDQHKKDSAEYGVIIERITKLQKLRSDHQIKPPSLDTVLLVGANIFGILWLTRYEKEHVISSKALGFVMKPR